MEKAGTLFVILVALSISSMATGNDDHSSKIDPMLRDGSVNLSQGFLVYLSEKADISQAKNLKTKEEKGRFVYEKRRAVAKATQKDIVAILNSLEIEHHAYWIINAIWVRGDTALMDTLAARPEVLRILPNPRIINDLPKARKSSSNSGEASRTVAWGVQKTGAPTVWDSGITGEGAVVAGADTGYDWEHPALKNQYRGFNGGVVDHDYSWHDAVHDSGGNCPADGEEPCDDSQHGTHTMGTMVGDDGANQQIGMAPGAKWIGCRNMHNGEGTPARYIECYEFYVAPYPIGGNAQSDGDPSMAPDVINNSWSCPPYEGCSVDTLLEIVDTVRAAGVFDASSAGNEGPECSTVYNPAGIYDAVISVGATNMSDWITGFSSLGPVTADGSDRLKPDISAPGDDIPSSVPGDSYTTMSGTSMASPHVAGMVGLLVSADPSISGDVDLIEDIIKSSAVPLTSSIVCGEYDAYSYPNPIYGYGRIDVPEALAYMDIEVEEPDPDPEEDAGSDTETSGTDSDADSDTDNDSDAGENVEGDGGGCSCSTTPGKASFILGFYFRLLGIID